MDEISVKDVLECVGENINPARDIQGNPSSGVDSKTTEGEAIKVNTSEFNLTRNFFQNLGILMQEYLTTTTLGDLMRKGKEDFNATAPYSDSVLDYLCNEMQMMANPSSTHQSGVRAKNELTAALNQVESIFSGIEKHKIFFHSGASEGISTFFQLSPKDVMVYFESDHPAVHSMALMNEKKGATVIKLPVNTDGSFDIDHVVSTINAYHDKNVYLKLYIYS
jgi:selenocysteine lyase/cysteine desulfurase